MPARTVIGGPLGSLIAALGGVDAFAARLGVWPHTVWRWGTRKTVPEKEMRKRINALARRRKLRAPFPIAA
jgi:hypothetical protein